MLARLKKDWQDLPEPEKKDWESKADYLERKLAESRMNPLKKTVVSSPMGSPISPGKLFKLGC